MNAGVLNVILLNAVAKSPAGDSVESDVIHAEANRVLDALHARARPSRLDRARERQRLDV